MNAPRSLAETPSRFELTGPAWFIDGLRQLARREKKALSVLIYDVFLEKFPELREQRTGWIGKVLRNANDSQKREDVP